MSYRGLQKNTRRLKTPKLEVVANQYPEKDYTVEIEFAEFTCLCPKTGLPDFATIRIAYIPEQKIVELKSLKYYFVSFRNVGIFHENVANRILDDLVAACRPRSATIEAEFGVRGGIKTTVNAAYPQ
jgi:7-cyano-7-deazaguanine reductase